MIQLFARALRDNPIDAEMIALAFLDAVVDFNGHLRKAGIRLTTIGGLQTAARGRPTLSMQLTGDRDSLEKLKARMALFDALFTLDLAARVAVSMPSGE